MPVGALGVKCGWHLPSWEETQRGYYFHDMKRALECSVNNIDWEKSCLFPKKIDSNLLQIDSVIDNICKNLITGEHNYRLEFKSSEKGFPSNYDISSNYIYFLQKHAARNELNDKESQLKAIYNVTGDINRVINRMIKKEPLYLIPEQVNTFKDFLNAFEDYRPDFPYY